MIFELEENSGIIWEYIVYVWRSHKSHAAYYRRSSANSSFGRNGKKKLFLRSRNLRLFSRKNRPLLVNKKESSLERVRIIFTLKKIMDVSEEKRQKKKKRRCPNGNPNGPRSKSQNTCRKISKKLWVSSARAPKHLKPLARKFPGPFRGSHTMKYNGATKVRARARLYPSTCVSHVLAGLGSARGRAERNVMAVII